MYQTSNIETNSSSVTVLAFRLSIFVDNFLSIYVFSCTGFGNIGTYILQSIINYIPSLSHTLTLSHTLHKPYAITYFHLYIPYYILTIIIIRPLYVPQLGAGLLL